MNTNKLVDKLLYDANWVVVSVRAAVDYGIPMDSTEAKTAIKKLLTEAYHEGKIAGAMEATRASAKAVLNNVPEHMQSAADHYLTRFVQETDKDA